MKVPKTNLGKDFLDILEYLGSGHKIEISKDNIYNPEYESFYLLKLRYGRIELHIYITELYINKGGFDSIYLVRIFGNGQSVRLDDPRSLMKVFMEYDVPIMSMIILNSNEFDDEQSLVKHIKASVDMFTR